ncbi:MAG: putative signal transducing protein, partial [Pedobacter sp.]
MSDKIIIYSTFYNPIEANIVKAKLEDAGIPCFLTDENVA